MNDQRVRDEQMARMLLKSFVNPYGEIHPADGLASVVAVALSRVGQLLLSWCDGHDTRFTLLLALPTVVGYVPGLSGLSGANLYVSVEGYGSYGFPVRDEPLHVDYVVEKLGRRGDNPNLTWDALAQFLGDVRSELARMK